VSYSSGGIEPSGGNESSEVIDSSGGKDSSQKLIPTELSDTHNR
jgi:hypothetical protein